MNTGNSSDAQSDRYGNPQKNAFTGRVLVIAFVVLLLGSLIYVVAQFNTSSSVEVSAQETGGSVVSDNRLNMRVDVTRAEPDEAAYCVVTAMDYDKNEVGRREFLIPAGGEETTRHSVDINTRVRAYAGKVYGCSTVIPPYLTESTK